MFAGLQTGKNVSFYAVPAALVLAIAPHFYAIGLLNSKHSPGTSGFDFSNPKKSRANISEQGLSLEDQEQYMRAEQANDNGFAGLPLFAAAIVAGNLARLPTKTLNTAAAVYLGSRVAFNVLYIWGTNNAMGIARTLSWAVGTLATLSLYVDAGRKFAELP